MDLRQLEFMVLLSETLHFGRAARRAFVSQSTFSENIARLEQEVGARLFDRTSNRVALTKAGKHFLENATRMIDDWARMTAEVQDLERQANGTLRIGVFADNAGEMTHLLLDDYRRRCPEVDLSFVGMDMSNQVDKIINGDVDVAFLRLPVADDGLVVHPLFAEPRTAILPVEHPLTRRRSIRIEEIVDEPFVTAVSDAPRGWGEFWRCDSVRGAPAQTIAEMNSVAEGLNAVAYLGAVDTCPAATARHHPHPGVAYVPIEDGQHSEAAIVHRRDDDRPQVRAFTSLADDALCSWLNAVPGAKMVSEPPRHVRRL